jgi:hypothetical protein
MSARSSSSRAEDGFAALEHELRGEQASALGRAGARVEEALEALREAVPSSPTRSELVDEAAHAVWCYYVQREALGISNHQRVTEFYRIPPEVLGRVGAVRR